MNIYLDIETIPGQSPALKAEIAVDIRPPGSMKKAETIARWEAEEKPLAIEAAWRKTSFHGDRGEVVCIAWAVDDNPVAVISRKMEGREHEERDLLYEFFDAIEREIANSHGRIPTWVGHNVRDFDLRFLFHRAVVLGARPPFRLPHDAKPGGEHVYDTMTAWAGYRDRISLDRLCKALAIPTKGTELGGEAIDGSKVWDFVKAGRIGDVAEYCRADVERVRRVHKRLTFADGLPSFREEEERQTA